MMKLLLVFVFACLAVVQGQTGICRFIPTGAADSSTISGTATFTVDGDDVTVSIDATGLPTTQSAVGIHVHTYGDIRPSATPGFNVGGHYNPLNVAYGCPGQAIRENGDMGNWTVDAAGTVAEDKTLNLLALTGGQSIIGRAVVIHQKYDNCSTGGLTSSGTRMAYCVIGIANPTPATTNGAYNNNETVTYGTCSLTNVNTSDVNTYGGLVTFTVTANGILVRANVSGLAASSVHGIHIHQYGDLAGSAQVGGHYDPLATNTHALPTFIPDAAHHVGDLGNICDTGADGVFYYQATFAAPKFADQNGVVGRAVVIHSGPDNNGTTTYGARVAYCVIGVAQADNLANAFATAPVTFTSPLCGYAAPTTAPAPAATTSDAADLATISVFIAITTILAMLF